MQLLKASDIISHMQIDGIFPGGNAIPCTHLNNYMNIKEKQLMNTIADVQSSRDLRNLPINQVGIKDLRFPITLQTAEGIQSTVARLTMTVYLPAEQKGTHMWSRFWIPTPVKSAFLSHFSARKPPRFPVFSLYWIMMSASRVKSKTGHTATV